jgi:hypothetical protein
LLAPGRHFILNIAAVTLRQMRTFGWVAKLGEGGIPGQGSTSLDLHGTRIS